MPKRGCSNATTTPPVQTLQAMLKDIRQALPPVWQGVNLSTFSPGKPLRDYQQEALRFALKALWKYYEDFRDYQPSESLGANKERKDKLWAWYLANEPNLRLDIPLADQRDDIKALLTEFYPAQNGAIPYRHFINRIGFWMATGSGKSLVLIKLIEQLHALIRADEIPPCPILVLTARDDLLAQLESHVDEFNRAPAGLRIRLKSLKAYAEVVRSFVPIIGQDEITVFTYRADNLSDTQGERILNVHNFENNGRWYVLLDEAHKGDREDSKRQHIYSILSRNGFLFNFSATFTDPRDVLTTAYNFNLSEFVRAGHSKHIVILKQESRAFAANEDYTGEEKQRIVLKSLLLLAHARQMQERLPDRRAYHRPLGLVLVHSVNTENADLKLFFKELERIARDDVSQEVWQQASDELKHEFAAGVEWLFERGRAPAPEFKDLGRAELLRLVFNAESPGAIDVLVHPSNRQELAFKLKGASQPFALIKIGDISGWLRENLEGYEILKGYADESFFAGLNAEDSSINLLMGSRTFYEGWDSNRPNVIMYINVGTGTQARKFILQSIGRGVRIESLPGHRRRLQSLYGDGQVDQRVFDTLSPYAPTLETLFILGASRIALETVIKELDLQGRCKQGGEPAFETDRTLLTSSHKVANYTIVQTHRLRKFEITRDELNQLNAYLHALDERVLLIRHGIYPTALKQLKQCLAEPQKYFITGDNRRFGRIDLMLSHVLSHLRLASNDSNKSEYLEG